MTFYTGLAEQWSFFMLDTTAGMWKTAPMTEFRRTHADEREAHTFELPGATEHYAADRPVVAEHIRIEVTLDFKTQTVRGWCTTRLKAIRKVSSVSFDARAFDVSTVEVNGKETSFSNTGSQIRVELRRAIEADSSAEVAIEYRCKPQRGLYFWGPDEGYPERPVQAWTQGQDEDSRVWFPCLDAPNQKATTEVIATFPADLTALSNGTLVSDTRRGARRTMHYRFDFPHSPYLVTLAVGEFEERSTETPGVQLRYLFPPGRADDALRCVERTPQMVEAFQEFTGLPYPYGSYAQVFVTEFIFGGMENTSATTLTDVVLHNERAHLDYSAEPLISHELAHQWFGDLLTCREWPHGWLNEGFATYFEVLWKERADGLDEADQHRRDLLDAYLRETREHYKRPIVARKFTEPIELFDAHLYQKGALVLQELRRRLGDEAFFKSIKHYVSTNKNRNVETVDLSRAIEDAIGLNFDRFFDQYVFEAGHPQLKVEVRYENENKRLRIGVKQTQKTKDGGIVYELPLRVDVATKELKSHTFEIKDIDHVFFVPAAEEPKQVLVDPRREILGTLEVDKALVYWIEELSSAAHARSRTEAALALQKDASFRAVEALSQSLMKDAFWATRAACARALGEIRTPEAKRALLNALKIRPHKARRAVVGALGNFRRDEDVGTALVKICEKGDDSYFVEGEAGRSLGKLRLKKTRSILEEMLKRPSFMDVVAAGAIDGLAESLDPKAYPIVEELAEYGNPMFMRRAAVIAVAKLAAIAEKKRQAVELISDLLRDPQFRVQMACFDAARALGDRSLLGVLESTPFLDGRAKRAAKETVRALREGEPQAKEVASLREDVDKLKGELGKLREQVESFSAKKLRGLKSE